MLDPHETGASSESRLAQLLNPISTDEFARDYYEKRECLIARRNAGFFGDLLTLADIDLILGTHGLKQPDINMVRADRAIAPSEYHRGGVADPVQVASLFTQGATLILSQLHERHAKLGMLCVELSRELSARTQTNVYLSPPRSQGFRPHWDTHDVLVLQIAGSKKWSLYDRRVDLPLRGQKFNPDAESVGEVRETFVLNQGDLLYIPRGVVHAAASGDELSLHITLGLITYTWADFFVNAVSAMAVAHPELRASLPMGFFAGGLSSHQELLKTKLKLLIASLEPNIVLTQLHEQMRARHRPVSHDALQQAYRSRTVSGSSVVARKRELMTHSRREDGTVIVSLGDQELVFPAQANETITYLLESPAIDVASLPGAIDLAGKINTVKTLVRHGVLRVEG